MAAGDAEQDDFARRSGGVYISPLTLPRALRARASTVMPPAGSVAIAVRFGMGAVSFGRGGGGWLARRLRWLCSFRGFGTRILTEPLFGVRPSAARWFSASAFGAFVQSSAA